MRMMRCKAQLSVVMRDGRVEVALQPGMVVDFDRVITPATGFTLGAAFEGREDCFESAEPAPKPAVILGPEIGGDRKSLAEGK